MTKDAHDTAWTSVRLKEGVLAGLGLPDLPFPVRKERIVDLFQDGRVRFELVLEEADRYVQEHPEAAAPLRPALVNLAHALAIHHGAEGRPAEAVGLLRMGLRYAPMSHRLHAALALGLHFAGDTDEAIRRYRALLENDGETAYPLLRVLAAKAAEEAGQFEEARDLLREGRALMQGDTPYEGLLQDLEVRTQPKEPEAPAEAPPPPEKAPEPEPQKAPKFCRACGAKLKPGKRFCATCGGETGAPR